MVKYPTLTTESGMPVADNQYSIAAGPVPPGARDAGFALRFFTIEGSWNFGGTTPKNRISAKNTEHDRREHGRKN